MNGRPPAERLFREWGAQTPPVFDQEAGRARFLERFAAGKGRPLSAWFVVAAAAAIACVVALGWSRAHSIVTFATAAGEGQAGTWLATSGTNELPLKFSEGTELVMEADSRGRVEELGRTGASFLLERGAMRARVVHRSSTSWRFLAGPFEVRVTGTVLGVGWDPVRERFAVRVDEGSVTVQGPSVGGLQVVRAGEQCVVDLPSRTTRLSPAGTGAGPDAALGAGTDAPGGAADAAASQPSTVRVSSPAAGVSWTRLEASGDYDGAYAAASSAGLAALLRASSADALLRLAQVARLSGHRDTERDALVTCRRRFPGSEAAAVAAYELGRSSSPGEASSWFDTYLGEEPNGPLAREAAGRLIEARAGAGDDRGARDAAGRYLARYPDGPHAALARRVLAGAHD